jgi:F0F1-type ATP synthase membrane subunit a
MSLTNRNVVLMAMLMLCIILMTVLTGIIIFEEDDQLPEEDDFLAAGSFAAAWFRIPVPQLSFVLMLGMSIFALIVVYRGGRSNHKRFNDRTIEPVKLLTVVFLKTALLRAVFNFLFFSPFPDHTKNKLTNAILFPTMIPILRRY